MLDHTASAAMLDMHRNLPFRFQEEEIDTLINMVDNTSLTVVLELLACFAHQKAKRLRTSPCPMLYTAGVWEDAGKTLDRAAEEVSWA